MAPVLRRLFPRAAIVHWCFDLYPEAITAEGLGQAHVEKVARGLMRIAYGAYDALVDIGPRMRERLAEYGAPGRQETLVPWALAETDRPIAVDTTARRALFPHAKLALLYSGTMGRAHEFSALLRLARACRARTRERDLDLLLGPRQPRRRARAGDHAGRHERLARAVRGRGDVARPPRGRGSASRQPARRLGGRRGPVEVLRVAGGRTAGPLRRPGRLGDRPLDRRARHRLSLTDGTTDAVADRLHQLLDDGDALARLRERALAVYRREWSKAVTNDRWDRLLRDLLQARA